LFTLLRSFTYVGWIVSRMNENGSQQRAERFIETATELAEEYLALSGQINNEIACNWRRKISAYSGKN